MGNFHKGVESFSVFPRYTRGRLSPTWAESQYFLAGGPNPPDTAERAGERRWPSLSDTCTSSAAWRTPAPRGASGPPQTAPALRWGCPAQACRSLAKVSRWLEPRSSAASPSLRGMWNETKAGEYWALWLRAKGSDCSFTHRCCRSFWPSAGKQELLVSSWMFRFCHLIISKTNYWIWTSLLTVVTLFYLRMLCWLADPSESEAWGKLPAGPHPSVAWSGPLPPQGPPEWCDPAAR